MDIKPNGRTQNLFYFIIAIPCHRLCNIFSSMYSYTDTTVADVGGGCRGCAPLPPEIKAFSSYSLLKFVYLTGRDVIP